MVKILVWDAVGNILWGVRLERIHGEAWRDKLRADDFAALDAAPQFDELFAGHDVELIECKSLEEVKAHIDDADILNLHKVNLPPDVLERGGKLRLVQHLGLDYRGLPVETAKRMGIPVAATPLINYLVVAEHNWALILNHLKSLPRQRLHMVNRAYVEQGWGAAHSLRLQIAADQTLGLCGFGEIARPMARYAQAFGMKAIYWDIRRFPELETVYNVEYVSLEELFSRADILSVQLALNEQTHRIIGAREIGMMKPTALFVNTARGKLVDQPALLAALQDRRIGGAGLDVMYEEPLPPDDPLHALHEDVSYNVTLTPHSAWQGSWTHVRDSLGIWHNVLHALRGEPVQYRIDG
jgi:phosphoglycerate dehydrogenase-like enzyme